MQAVHRPVNMDIESPPHIPGPINGNPYAIVNQAMKMKCRADSESADTDYPGETKIAKFNGDSNIFQFPTVIGEQQIRDENRKAAMNELLGNLGVDSASMDSTSTVTITTKKHVENPQPPQRQSSLNAAEKIKKKTTTTQIVETSSIEVPMIQTAPNEDQNLYYASHYAASQPGKVKAKLHVDLHSGGQISPTASPELISNRKMLLDVIEGGSDDDLPADFHDTDSESEEEISYHESPTLPKRGNVADKVKFLSKSIAFSPPPNVEEQNKRKNTSVPLIGLTALAPTDITDRIAKHNEKSLAAGQVMSTANMVLYSSKQPPKKVVEYDPHSHEERDEEVEDFRTAPVLRHHQEGWNKVETNDSDTSEVYSDKAIEEDFPPPPPPIYSPPVVHTIKLGQPAEFRLNIQVSDTGKLEPVQIRDADSGCEDASSSSPPPGIKIDEPAIKKELVKVEESVNDEILDELFREEPKQQLDKVEACRTQKPEEKQDSVVQRLDSEEKRYAEEDEAAGYSRIEDIEPGQGQEYVQMNDVKENGMTDEEFLNSYKPIPDEKDVEVSPKSPHDNVKKLSSVERGPAVLNELINGIRSMKQEMSSKAKAENLESDVFPTSPTSDKSSLSPSSTLSRGKRRHRKASDKGYGSTNSSLSESGFVRQFWRRLFIFLSMFFGFF